MAEKLVPWNAGESEKMCDAFWKLSETDRVRVNVLSYAKKVEASMRESAAAMGLDVGDVSRAQQVLAALEKNDQTLVQALIKEGGVGRKLKRYIIGVQKRGANMMDGDQPNNGKFYRFTNADVVAQNVFDGGREEREFREGLVQPE